MSQEKKTFRVIGVDRKRLTIQKYAESVERSLNKMTDEGYDLKYFEVTKTGAILMGRVLEQMPQAPGVMIPLGFVQSNGTPHPLEYKNPHSFHILRHVMKGAEEAATERSKKEHMENAANEVLSRLPVAEASIVVEDAELAAERHDQSHKESGAHDCKAPEALRQFAKVLKAKIQGRLQ
jgi:hypothetical protein